MWFFKPTKPKTVSYNFKLSDLTIEEKIDILFDHMLISKFDQTLVESDRLILKINPDSILILQKKSYFSKLTTDYKGTGS